MSRFRPKFSLAEGPSLERDDSAEMHAKSRNHGVFSLLAWRLETLYKVG